VLVESTPTQYDQLKVDWAPGRPTVCFVSLCIGGIGTILWPLSERLPKQDYRMSNRTLLCFSLHYGGNRTILWPRSKTPPTSSWQTVLLARKSNRTRLTGSQYDQLASSCRLACSPASQTACYSLLCFSLHWGIATVLWPRAERLLYQINKVTM
jgi:hypothetical protein